MCSITNRSIDHIIPVPGHGIQSLEASAICLFRFMCLLLVRTSYDLCYVLLIARGHICGIESRQRGILFGADRLLES